MPARPAAALVLALDNAALALRNQGVRRAPRETGAALFERFGLAGSRRRRRTSSPAGCASGSPFCGPCSLGKPVLALDEPFASLDAITRAENAGVACGRELRDDPRTVVLVSHDVEEALYLSDRVALCRSAGAIVAELRAPRPRAVDRDSAVTTRLFVAVREEAMRALREGMR